MFRDPAAQQTAPSSDDDAPHLAPPLDAHAIALRSFDRDIHLTDGTDDSPTPNLNGPVDGQLMQPPMNSRLASPPMIDNGGSGAPMGPNQMGPSQNGLPPFNGPSGPNGDPYPQDYLRQRFSEPLGAASCGNRPVHVDGFIGAVRASDLITGEVRQSTGFIGGGRIGWDYDPYWGVEMRLAYSSIQESGLADPSLESADKVLLWDTSWVYYPWGDTRYRPFFSIGLGLAEFQFLDQLGEPHRRGLVELPFGFGCKYRVRDWLTLRAEVFDDMGIGEGNLATVHMVTFFTGFEYHFGGYHKSYWPWEPSGW